MVRKRKVAATDEEKENETKTRGKNEATTHNTAIGHGPMYTIMSNVQLNETFHKKYIKEMKQLYAKMDHDAFMFTFIKMIKSAMEGEEGNEFAHTALQFCAKFLSSFDGEETHPLLLEMFNWLLSTISYSPHIRFRLCQFVNMILNALGYEAALDDAICDNILEYMLERLRDVSPNVRVQAILAMQRLQVPDNPDDQVLRAYQFHLCSDPSPRVRQSVITCMGRNYLTIPYILDRLWDNDEKVRRHTYLHMSSYPVRSYKVAQRLTLLEQGLNDRSESVRKVVTSVMLQQWIESYQKNIVSLVSALKLDASEKEVERFRKITKQTLKEIFRRQSKADLLACLPIEEDGEFHRCVPHEKLTIEITLYWQCLTEYFLAEMAEELDYILPELSTFCAYIEKFCQTKNHDMDKFEGMEFQYMLLSLMDILYTFDLGDEIGRGNLHKLLIDLLQKFNLDEKVIEVIVRCAENLITDQNARLQYFIEIIRDICNLNAKPNDLIHDRTLVEELLANSSDPDLKLKLSELKVKILDLEEQQSDFEKKADYEKSQRISELRTAVTDEYINLLKPLVEQHSLKQTLQLTKVVKNDTILKSLQIAFYMVVSQKVQTLNPNTCSLYKNFICRHIASNQIAIRDWALKCGTAYSLLYEPLAKGVFLELYKQFHKNHNIRIWETSVTCIFELLDRYGLDTFVVQGDQNKTKKSGRQLYNTLEFIDDEDESQVSMIGQDVSIIYTMSHLLDKCDDVCITSAIINGFCRLVLRGYIKSGDIIEKLLLRYFNPTTDEKINQFLGVFLENLIQRKKHALLQPCILPTVTTVLSASYDSPLHDIRPETITRFYIDATRQETCSNNGNLHNKLALTFLEEMCNNENSKELCKLLAKDLTSLELNLSQNEQVKSEMRSMTDTLIKSDFDPKTIKLLINFKDMLDGNFSPPVAKNPEDIESDDEGDEETAATESSKQTTNATIPSSDLDSKEATITETPVESTVVEEKTLTPGKNNETNTTKQETSTLVEESVNATETETAVAQPIEAVNTSKNISPSVLAPTTYGRDNKANHRYLRKSLNMSRNQSDSETVEGPSRPAKIRIEVRIDSDKKTSETKQNEQSPKSTATTTRARRNLRNGESNENATKTVASSNAKKAKSPEKQQQQEQQQQKQQKQIRSPVQQKTKEIAVVQERSPRKVETKADKLNNKSKGSVNTVTEKNLSAEEEVSGSSDEVPASPIVMSPRIRSTRFRRAQACNETLRSTRISVKVIAMPIAKSPVNRTTGNNSLLQRSLHENISTSDRGGATPIRNGRKRVLKKTPHCTTDVSSPIRKQMRSENLHGQSQRRTKTSTPVIFSDNIDKSPSSTKAIGGTAVDNFEKNIFIATAKDLDWSPNKQIIETSRGNSSRRVDNNRSKANTGGRVELSKTAVATRNSTRTSLQLRNSVTRRRLSLDNKNDGASTNSSMVIDTKKPGRQKKNSKIPIKSNKANKKVAPLPTFPSIGSTSSDNTITRSNSEDSSSSNSTSAYRTKAINTMHSNVTVNWNTARAVSLARTVNTRNASKYKSGIPTRRAERNRNAVK